DHDDLAAGSAVADYCARRNLPLRVYPGSEVSARCTPAGVCGQHDVHVLGFELTEEIPPWQSVEAPVEATHRQGGFVVMPHPRLPGRGYPTFDQILALELPVSVEIYNAAVRDTRSLGAHRGEPDINVEARAFYEANRPRLAGATGGTDAHFRTIGRGL